VSFFVRSRLVGSDSDDLSGDVYAFDADGDELVRVSAPQGGPGGDYACATDPTVVRCNADTGLGGFAALYRRTRRAVAGGPGERSVFFQSKSRLVSSDVDGDYDVYEWREGELSLLSPGTATPAYYAGSSADGDDVFVMTRDRLSWQDVDSVMDVYDAKVGGGFDPPAPAGALCSVLADGCQGPTPERVATAPATGTSGGGNAPAAERGSLRLAVSGRARRKAARSGVLAVRVRAPKAGVVKLVARAPVAGRLRRVAGARKRVAANRTVSVRLRLSKPARRRLAAGRRLEVALEAAMAGVHSVSRDVAIKRGRR
jgi:hypothetical protein